jgi:rhamnosyl/mannosyltransferase
VLLIDIRMNIIHIYKDYYPVLGGMENHIRQLAEAQALLGHQVTVLVTNTAGRTVRETMNGVHVIKAARQVNVQSAPLSAAFPSLVQQETANCDIVHLHAPYPPGEACNLWFGRGKRTIITWHSDIVRQKTLLRLYAPLLRQVLRRADCILPTSAAYARSSPWLRQHLDKCVAVPLGVDANRFSATPSGMARTQQIRAELLAHWPSHKTTPTILLSVGRLRYYKGLDDLIRAMPMLPNALAVIAGRGPMETAWKALATELGVADRVYFPGDVSDADLPSLYRAADLYVLPANERAEAFGIAILEAMASELPVVCTEVGTATSWINQHNQTGLVVPAKSPDAIAKAIEHLQNDPDQRRRMGNAARQRIEDEFTLDKMIQRVLDVYQRVLTA